MTNLQLRSGWLWKEGGNFKTWKRRWCQLFSDGCLWYYDKEGGKLYGVIDLTGAQVRIRADCSRTSVKFSNLIEVTIFSNSIR